jgi:hypothetical protein
MAFLWSIHEPAFVRIGFSAVITLFVFMVLSLIGDVLDDQKNQR